ncbi:hypothetical protein [Streptomyces morookaense]|uniref:Uncharacterized protein n=1 Tax=Streptomyces morookaense TaxID=1970 RepID=A0A7Y7B2K2_STRMO|nr:hypothetical protein [Streptomyces morookaense]NVK77679.1 hypothetical protein [Streptomyces morookaense]GHF05360.1 hypothetical protein GCM10010359_02910 [Streptomyces morookaense]
MHTARHHRWLPALGLLLLSPVCAEYLIGYDQIIGRPRELLAGLLILAPLYGAVAVMIREAARRTGRGWPTILLLSAAFGLAQAGLIDQSLFNPHFVDEPSWDRERSSTLVPVLGISLQHTLNFLAGHVIWSFAAPIAVVESLTPRLADRPWLRRGGMAVMALLYCLGAAVIFREHTKKFMASPVQLGVTAVIVLTLVALAFTLPRRRRPMPGRVPPPLWLTACTAVALLATHQLIPPTWAGVALDVLSLSLGAGLLLRWSSRAQWGRMHILAVSGSALVVNAGLSFVVQPNGQVAYAAKYVANATLMLGVLALLAAAHRRLRRAEATANAEGSRQDASRLTPLHRT